MKFCSPVSQPFVAGRADFERWRAPADSGTKMDLVGGRRAQWSLRENLIRAPTCAPE